MLGEFLCANVSTPFLLFMVKGTATFFAQILAYFHASAGFGEFSDEGEVAFWTGILDV